MKTIYNPSIPFPLEINQKRYDVFLKKVNDLRIQLKACQISGTKVSTKDFRLMLRKSKSTYLSGLGDIYHKLFLHNNIVRIDDKKSVIWSENNDCENILKKCYMIQNQYAKTMNEMYKKNKVSPKTTVVKNDEPSDDLRAIIKLEVQKQLSQFFSTFNKK